MLFESNANIIGIAKNFSCKWKYENNVFLEERSNEHGVAGYFIFKDKSYLADVPLCGEFVRWLQQKNINLKNNLYIIRMSIVYIANGRSFQNQNVDHLIK